MKCENYLIIIFSNLELFNSTIYDSDIFYIPSALLISTPQNTMDGTKCHSLTTSGITQLWVFSYFPFEFMPGIVFNVVRVITRICWEESPVTRENPHAVTELTIRLFKHCPFKQKT